MLNAHVLIEEARLIASGTVHSRPRVTHLKALLSLVDALMAAERERAEVLDAIVLNAFHAPRPLHGARTQW